MLMQCPHRITVFLHFLLYYRQIYNKTKQKKKKINFFLQTNEKKKKKNDYNKGKGKIK